MKSMSADAVNAMNKIDLLRMKLAALREQMAYKMSLGKLDAKGIANAALQIKNVQAQIDKVTADSMKKVKSTAEEELEKGKKVSGSEDENVRKQIQWTWNLKENIRLIATEWFHIDKAVENVSRSVAGISPKIKLVVSAARSLVNIFTKIASSAWNVAKGIAKWAFHTALSTIKSIFNFMKKIASKAVEIAKNLPAAFAKLTGLDSIKKSLSGVQTILKSLGRIAFYRMIRSAIKAVTEAFKEGSERAYFYAKEYGEATRYIAESLDTLSGGSFKMQNQLGAAWATLLATIEPILIRIINLVTKAAEVVTQFFAILGGKSVYLKAKDYTKAWVDETEKGSKAAKEWRNQLLAFDEINRLDAPSDSGGGGGGSNYDDYGNMFEEAKISSKFFDDLKDAFEKGEWDRLGRIIGDKFNEIVNSIDFSGLGKKIGENVSAAVSVAYRFLKIADFRNLGSKIALFLDSIGDEIDFNKLGRLSVRISTALWDTFVGAIDFLSKGNNARDLAVRMSDFILGAFQELTDWIASLDPHAIAMAIKGFFSGIKYTEIRDTFFTLIKTAWSQAIALKDEIWDDETKEKVENAVNGFFNGMKWGDIKDIIVDKLKSAWTWVTDRFNEIWPEEDRKVFLENVKSKLQEILVNAINGIDFAALHNVLMYKLDAAVFGESWAAYHWSQGDYAGKELVMGLIHGEEYQAPKLQSSTNTFLGDPVNNVLDNIETSAKNSGSTISKEIQDASQSVSSDMNNMAVNISGNAMNIQSSSNDIATAVHGVNDSFYAMGLNGADTMDYLDSTVFSHGQNMVNNLGTIRDAAIEAWNWLKRISDKGEARIEENGGIWNSLGGFASGGFPEDGLFMANHSELVGKFSNGRTAVANNEQITSGIADAVYGAFMTAFSQTNGNGSNGQPVNIYLDGRQIAQSTTKYQNQFARASGI